MDNQPSPQPSSQPAAPLPEVLRPRTDAAPSPAPTAKTEQAKKPLHRSYRPSHRATLIGLAAVIAILAINAAVIALLLKKQAAKDTLNAKGQVSLSSSQLNSLGINRSELGPSDVQLTVAPNAQFKGTLSVNGSTTLGGQVNLNNKLNASSADITQLDAGNTNLTQLNVNGNGTLNTLNLRKDLAVAGVTQLQNALTVNNSATVSGNLTVGGTLSVNTFSARSLTSVTSLTVGGHIITGGPTPGVSRGGATGSNGTVGISGNDTAGSISINIGAGAPSGTLANVSFSSRYGNIPHVVITPVGVGANFYVLNLSTTGFSVGVASGLPPGGFVINYIVEQ
ncbi:MAG TPA: hypothetical protein VFH37_00040 [Candidatus Saccharimonadales bacterium]|nr:hypothetical protein [Candidatus Saccharimonadales bacterium]